MHVGSTFTWRHWGWSLLALLSTALFVAIVWKNLDSDEGVERKFRDFVRRYAKMYYVQGDRDEYQRRLSIFREALAKMDQLNTNRSSPDEAQYGVTKFSDLTPEEFRSQLLHYQSANNLTQPVGGNRRHRHRRDSSKIPEKVDWRSKGLVTPVKNQKDCGACWAFSVVETIETMEAVKKGGQPEELSVQQVIDCALNGNHGCNGGDTCSVLEWLSEANVNVTREKNYPLTLDRSSTCNKKAATSGIRIAPNFTCNNLVGSEEEMTYRLATHGPLVTAIDAQSWQYYLGGIIQFHCEQNINHAVQVVGYDNSARIPHYIVRNSWGEDFGNSGYLYIAIGKNLCGIAMEVSVLSVL